MIIGGEFINSIVKNLTTACGFAHDTIAANNPRENGLAESQVKLTKMILVKIIFERDGAAKLFWSRYLPAVQFFLNGHVSRRTGSAPSELFFGRRLNPFKDYSALELKDENVEKIVEEVKAKWVIFEDVICPGHFLAR